MSTTNLATILTARCVDRAATPALFGDDGRSWSFDEIDLIAGGVAAALRAEGIGAGDRVAFYLTNGPETVFFLFGAWKIGAVPVTISSLYNAAELTESLAKTKPQLLLVDGRRADVVGGLSTEVLVRSIDDTLAGVPVFDWRHQQRVDAVEVDADAEACILFTGGTTGRPKAVSVTHAGTLGSLQRLARVSTGTEEEGTAALDAKPNLIALPLFHSGGQHSLLFAFFVGRPAVVWERFSIDLLADLMERYRFDNFFFLPTMVFDIVHAERDLPFEGVKSVLVAGQAISWTVRRAFEERYQVPILVNYGSTESGHIAGWNGRDMKAGLWKPGSAGKVYPGVELEIRDDGGRPQPVGTEGEVVVRSEMTKGYVDDAAASAELVRDGWVHTGDMGYVDQDGVLWLSGRKRDMIKCAGFQVWPEEIEDALRAHPLVRDIRVVGVPDDRLGEIPVALVVRGSDASLDDDELAAALVAFAREELAHFKTPRRIEFVAELERSATGKISRASVPDLAPLDGGSALMKFGIMASHQYPHGDELGKHLGDLFGTVESAAELGYDSVWTINHFGSNLATPQPISMMASLIPRTGNMTLGTGILLLPLFHPVHVAEEFATLDHLSGGRVVLGVGAGYRENEFAAFGVDPDSRFRRLDESLRLIRDLWSGEVVNSDGEFYPQHDATIGIKPLTPGGPPIWVGAGGKLAVRRAARLGDAWYAPGNSPSKRFLPEHVAVYDEALVEVGKDPSAVERPVGVELYCASTTEQAVEEALPHARTEYSTYAEYPALRWQRDRFDELVVNTLMLGSPEDLIGRISVLKDLGFNHVIFRPGWLGMPSEKVRASLRLFADEVFPAFR